MRNTTRSAAFYTQKPLKWIKVNSAQFSVFSGRVFQILFFGVLMIFLRRKLDNNQSVYVIEIFTLRGTVYDLHSMR